MSAIEKLPDQGADDELDFDLLPAAPDLRFSLAALRRAANLGIPIIDRLLGPADEEQDKPGELHYIEDYRDAGQQDKPAAEIPEIPEALTLPEVPDRLALAGRDRQLACAAQSGDRQAFDELFRFYEPFIRLKASAYFIAGATGQDVIQEGNIGFYKAVRDYDGQSASFRVFAELCITRQIITAVKTALRHKHRALNEYVSFGHTPANSETDDLDLGNSLPAKEPAVEEIVISSERLSYLVERLGTNLSFLEHSCLKLYLEGRSYEEMAAQISMEAQGPIDTKSIDNALQRVKRKIIEIQDETEYPSPLLAGHNNRPPDAPAGTELIKSAGAAL